MSDEVYRAIANATSGFVESPAGCGKTEAIVRTVGTYCSGCQLILTHTHSGVDALRQRFREHNIPTGKYHIDTIAGWSWGWVRNYPSNADYQGSTEIAVWNEVYAAMSNLLQKNFVRKGVLNSYAGIIVDEYQDCTVSMHRLIADLKRLLPCRVLGDDLQGVFGFGDDPLIGWSDVRAEFVNNLGLLQIPHRWIKASNRVLGEWLMGTRPFFRKWSEPDYRGSPIDRRTVSYADLSAQLIRLTHEKEGKICVIGPKARPLPAGIETALVNHNYRVLEPNELSVLRKLIVAVADGSCAEKSQAALEFLTRVYGGFSADESGFIRKILRGEAQRPRRADRQALCEKHTAGATAGLLLDLLQHIESRAGISCKLRESVTALKCILEAHLQSDTDLKILYADEIARRKYQSRSHVYRCIGSTLLVKGLEFDHAVILRSPEWQKSWGNHKDLYVALTRGSKTTTLMELTS
jgi:DNA helicase-2/ATP-dependent DNA helicase PcrA